MMPPSWKTEIEETVEKAAHTASERQKAENDKNASEIASEIKALNGAYQTQHNKPEKPDKVKRALDIATVFLLFATAMFTGLAWWVFRDQLHEMQSSGEQTAKLIGANAKLADAAAKQADAADKQANAMIAAVEVSRESLIVSGRAWVGPSQAKITSPIEAGKPIEIFFEYSNTGREPALDFSYSVDGFISSNEEERRGTSSARVFVALNNCKAVRELAPGQVAFPNTGFSNYNLTAKIPPILDQAVIDGEKTLIVQGCFSYRSFKIVRHSYFCFYYRGKTTKPDSLNICTAGHYAD